MLCFQRRKYFFFLVKIVLIVRIFPFQVQNNFLRPYKFYHPTVSAVLGIMAQQSLHRSPPDVF